MGAVCTKNSDCESDRCQGGLCYYSSSCKPIKEDGPPNFQNLNIVFVGSGFVNKESFEEKVNEMFSLIQTYDPFSANNQLFMAYFVNTLVGSYCSLHCQNRSTLLCCDLDMVYALTAECFQPGTHIQTIVVENTGEYGGAGYFNANVATTSLHEYGGRLAVHELGHSLFQLGDEYESSKDTSTKANCDNDGCPKFTDLIGHFDEVTCDTKGCTENSYFIGERSLMDSLDLPLGHVNTRYTCCTFLAFTGEFPSYCERFDFQPNDLREYCDKDYQGHYDSDNTTLRSAFIRSLPDIPPPLTEDIYLFNNPRDSLYR